ncbi:lysine--tRNA ligase, partial [Salmonella enterica subsp. enterica]
MTEPTRAPAEQAPAVDENKIIAERREKLQALRQQGVAFPNDFRPTHQAASLHAQYGEADQAAL